jgi:hypothetical protein
MRGVSGRKEGVGISRVAHRAVADMSVVAVSQQAFQETTKLTINSKLIDKGRCLHVHSHFQSRVS